MIRAGISEPALIIVLALVVLALLWLGARLSFERRPPYRRGRFLTVNEKCFLSALDEAVGERYRVFAQVRLADMVDVDFSVSDKKRRAAIRRMFGKSVDFVVCSAATLDPVAAIEVDDRTHLLPHRQERDVFVNAVFAEIGLPLVRASARRSYSAGVVRKMLADVGVDCGPARAGLKAMERL